jgi:hypothetical protein
MSGPKVVKIVTREEIIAICEGHLKRLDQVIAQWTKEGKKIDQLTDDDVSATLVRRQKLAELLAQDAFMELQKRVPNEITFLRADMNRREQAAIEKAAQLRQRQRQAQENAAALLNVLQTRKLEVPTSLLEELQSLADGRAIDHADTILSTGYGLIVPNAKERLTDEQRTLAARLNEGDVRTSFSEWKDQQVKPAHDNALFERVDRQIAEANTLLREDEATAFVQRLNVVEAEVNEARRNLLVDSLILDLAKEIEVARARRAAHRQVEELVFEIQSFKGEDFVLLCERIAACNADTPASELIQLATECREVISRQLQQRAAQARREVILQGLARLGYEVHEGMATAWAQEGRVVLRKPAVPEYGIEVGGHAESGRLQVRAVALRENRDTSRDRDVETIWCGEFARLQQLVGEDGGDLSIERAMGVGQIPLKYIDQAFQDENADVAAKRST